MDWGIIAGTILALATTLDAKKEKDHERVNDALEALSEAYYSTLSYYETIDATSANRRSRQIELAQKWDRVSMLTRRYDEGLSSRFSLKSRFWKDGEAWTNQKISSAKIELAKIQKDGQFLLIPKQKKVNKKRS